jgi:hypothetical protein
MKKATITLALLFASLIGFSQNKTAKGTVLDINSRSAITNAVVSINDTSISTTTNDAGKFSIEVPKSFHTLTVQHEGYADKEIILRPGFQHLPIPIYLQSEQLKNEEKAKDSIFNSRKNTLSLSTLELINVTLAGNYERLFSEKHSLGAYLSIYIYGRNLLGMSEYDYYPHYQGFKFAPDYRYYPIKNNRVLFIEGKLQVGYIHFSKLPYHYGDYTYLYQNIQYSLWTGGFGASVGFKINAKKAILTFVLGYQYFPIHVPATIERVLHDDDLSTLTTDTYWWYQGGPGCPFVFKFLIGGTF